MYAMNDRIAKLPKWARDHIRKLEVDTAYLKSQIDAMSSEGESVYWTMGESKHGLPEHCTVYFGAEYPNRVRVRLDRHGNIIVAGDDVLNIQPAASNVILVRSESFKA